MRTGAFLKTAFISVLLLPASGGWSDAGVASAQGDCDANSAAWMNNYRMQANYVPGMPLNPSGAIKTIKVSIHIWRGDNGEFALLDDPINDYWLSQMLVYVENAYSNYIAPSDPIPGYTYTLSDNNIRFEVIGPNGPNTAYYNDDYDIYSLGCIGNGYAMSAAALALHPECENTYMIHYTCQTCCPTDGAGTYPIVNDFAPPCQMQKRAIWEYYFNEGFAIFSSPNTGHEMYHSLDLRHNYDGSMECGADNAADFFYDVFGTSQPWCSPLAPCEVCPHQASAVCTQLDDVFDPLYTCTNNIMGGVNQEAGYSASHLQIGRMHRTLMTTNMSKYAWGYDPTPYTVQQNETWDFHIKFFQDIIVPAGVTLTVRCELHMVPEARIIVQPGGRLIVDGGIIQAALYSPKRWRGVEIRGNGNLPQTLANQGYLELRNGAVIADATRGIFVGSSNNLNGGGGIVRSLGSPTSPCRITNCSTGVQFYPYLYPVPGSPYTYAANASYFLGTRFEVNEAFMEYPGGVPFTNHARLNRIYGLIFRSCTFINTREAMTSAELGHGIRAQDAHFLLTTDRFEGLDHGVHSTGTQPHAWFSAQASVFKNNICGAFVSGQSGCRIIGNRFVMGLRDVQMTGPEDAGFLGYHRGIFTHETFKFRIESNVLQREDDPLATQLTEGIVIGYNRDWNDIVRSNRSIDLDRGFVGEGVNCSQVSGYANIVGLQFKCDECENTLVNILSRPDASVPPLLQGTHSIRTHQGDLTSTADNQFDNWPSGGLLTDDFRVTTTFSPIKYLHRAGAPFTPLDFTPIWLGPWLVTPPPSYTCPAIAEPPFMMDPRDPQLSAQELEDEKLAYGNVRYQYEQLIDGGNTDEVVQDVMDAWPQDYLDLRDRLLGKSPYLSIEVLMAAMEKQGFPDALRTEVCIANPEATQKEGFIKWLQYECSYPLPEYLIGSIVASWNIKTYRSTLEAQMAGHHERYSQAAVDWAEHYLTDTTQVPLDTLLKIYQEVRTPAARYAEASIYLERGEYAAAEAVMNGLPLEHALKTPEVIEQARMLAWIGFVQGVRQSGRTLEFELTGPEIAQIEGLIGNAQDRPAIWMSNLLCFHYDICRPVHTGGEGDPKSLPTQAVPVVPALRSATLDLVPNPATNWISINFDTEGTGDASSIQVRDVMGRITHQATVAGDKGQLVWDCRAIPAGTYAISRFSSSGALLATQRAIIRP